MSGHSKWSSIKHKKAKVDAQRGKTFAKLIKEISVAARQGGGDPESNPRLRSAIQSAKDANMPSDNIERAIKKGTGELPGVQYEECVYEGYGPGGVAIMLEVMTDNKNRTSSELRKIFSKCGGNLGSSGCVAWMFRKKGMITVSSGKCAEEKLMEIALDGGAEDITTSDDAFEVVSSPENYESVRKSLDDGGIKYELAEITMLPSTTVKVEAEMAHKVLRTAEALEEQEDVQHVYANFDIPDEALQNA